MLVRFTSDSANAGAGFVATYKKITTQRALACPNGKFNGFSMSENAENLCPAKITRGAGWWQEDCSLAAKALGLGDLPIASDLGVNGFPKTNFPEGCFFNKVTADGQWGNTVFFNRNDSDCFGPSWLCHSQAAYATCSSTQPCLCMTGICHPCANGTYAVDSGGYGSPEVRASCKACPAGRWNEAAAASCPMCTPGQYESTSVLTSGVCETPALGPEECEKMATKLGLSTDNAEVFVVDIDLLGNNYPLGCSFRVADGGLAFNAAPNSVRYCSTSIECLCSTCTSCPNGTFAAEASAGRSSCTACPVGQTQPASGQTSCLEKCGTNSQIDEATSKCACIPGFFSQTPTSPCKKVPSGAVCTTPIGCKPSNFKLSAGFWRTGPKSSDIIACPDKDACSQNSTLDQCAPGHGGPMCTVCKNGWAYGEGLRCEECQDSTDFALWLIIIVVVLPFAYVMWLKCGCEPPKWWSSLSVKAKVMVSFLQILTQITTVYNIKYPQKFLEFVETWPSSTSTSLT